MMTRGYRGLTEAGKWVYGFYFMDADATGHFIKELHIEHPTLQDPGGGECWTEDHAVIRESVGQCVGWQDSGGKYIYEGDILSVHQFLFDGNEIEKEWVGEVVWVEDWNCAGFGLKVISGEYALEHTGYDSYEDLPPFTFSEIYGLHDESFKKIGNIHETN